MSLLRYALLGILVLSFAGCIKPPGIDQLGGTRLTYSITSEKPFNKEIVLRKFQQRLDPNGIVGIQVSLEGEKLQVSVPNVKGVDIERVKKLATSSVSLEFVILAERGDTQLMEAWTATATEADDKPLVPVKRDGVVIGRWVAVENDPAPAIQVLDTHIARNIDGKQHVLCRVSEFDVDSRHFASLRKSEGERTVPCVNFTLTDDGSIRMSKLSAANIGRQLAVVFGGRIVSAPTIQSTISARGQISGRFTEQEVDELIRTLAAGPLPFEFASKEPQVEMVEPPK